MCVILPELCLLGFTTPFGGHHSLGPGVVNPNENTRRLKNKLKQRRNSRSNQFEPAQSVCVWGGRMEGTISDKQQMCHHDN